MPGFVKPAWPAWQPGKAPAGCKLYVPLAEGAGTTTRDYAGGLNGSFVGTPAWQRGLYGPQLGGFTTANYTQTTFDSGGTGYPLWLGILYDSPASSASTWQNPVTLGLSTTTANGPKITIALNRSAVAGQLRFDIMDDAGTSTSASPSGLPLSDGNSHTVFLVSRATNRHEIYFDGLLRGTSATTLGPITLDRLYLGVNRFNNGAVFDPHKGAIQCAAVGRGSVPDPLALAQDLLSGRFSAVRPSSNLALWAALAGGSPVAPTGSPAAIMMSGL